MTTEITYHSNPFPYVIIDDLYSEEELRLIWKDFNHVYPLLLPGDKTGSAKDNGVFQKKNKGIFINHEDNTILRLGGKTWSLLNTLKESLNPGEWWLKNIRTSDSKTLVSYYEDTDYYKAHSDCAEITALSWYYKEPKKYRGGDLKFTDYNIDVECKNNRCIIFPSMIVHEVSEIKMNKGDMDKKLGRWTISQFTWMDNNGPDEIVKNEKVTSVIEDLYPTPTYWSQVKDYPFINNEIDRVMGGVDFFDMSKRWGSSHSTTSDFNKEVNIIEELGLESIRKEIDNHVREYCAELEWEFREYWMESWFTRYKKGDYSDVHRHGDSDISGVYFYKTNGQDGDLFFLSPTAPLSIAKCYHQNGLKISHQPQEGKMILFPGWLQHGVNVNNTDNIRMSLAFNIRFI